MAGAATVDLRLVRRELDVGEDRAEKQPGAEVAADQIGVLALPADAGGSGKRLLHERRGIDEHLDVGAGPRGEARGDLLQPALDQVVIVAVAGVDRDGRPVLPSEACQRVVIRPVVEAEHHHRAHAGP